MAMEKTRNKTRVNSHGNQRKMTLQTKLNNEMQVHAMTKQKKNLLLFYLIPNPKPDILHCHTTDLLKAFFRQLKSYAL